MDWYSIEVNISDKIVKDLLSAYAFEIGCQGMEDLDERVFLDGSEEQQSGLKLHFSQETDYKEIVKLLTEHIASLEMGVDIDSLMFKIEEIEKQNWREQWKVNYKPIDVGDFMVLPIWLKDTVTDKIKILIEPKMAFGTGTHETTGMMLDMISRTDIEEKKVLDAGTGSGILAIACAKKGASKITAVDIEEESIDNSKENAEYNSVLEKIEIKLADDNTYANENIYDIVIANINRVVLIELMDNFYKVAQKGATILLTGILIDEKQLIYNKIDKVGGMKQVDYIEKNEWCCMKFIKE